MTEYEYKTNMILSYAWLVVVIVAILGAFIKGAWHQLLIAAIAGVMYFVTHPRKRVHIPEDAYAELNDQILSIVSTMDGDHKEKTVEVEIQDGIMVSLVVEINQSVSRSKFSDNAWGATKIFTETNWYCTVDIQSVIVRDERLRILDSDFNEDLMTLEYESTEWN